MGTPDALPILGAGSHRDPSDGACLMEYVSVIAGERFSDRPATVHPVLAALARVVNDLVSDDVRPLLVVLAPDLVGTAEAGCRADPVIAAIVASAAAQLGSPGRGPRAVLDSARKRIRAYDGPNRFVRWRLWATARGYRSRAAYESAHLAASAIAPAGDAPLVGVLEAAVAECRRQLTAETPARSHHGGSTSRLDA